MVSSPYERTASGIRRSPWRGERPVYARVRKEECDRHTPQCVKRRGSGIRCGP